MDAEKLVLLGLGVIVAGFFLVVIGSLLAAGKEKAAVRGGGIIFLGPFPFGFASDKKTLYLLLGFSVLVLVFWYLVLRR